MSETKTSTQMMVEYVDANHGLTRKVIAAAIAKLVMFIGVIPPCYIFIINGAVELTPLNIAPLACLVVPYALVTLYFQPRVTRAEQHVNSLRLELVPREQ